MRFTSLLFGFLGLPPLMLALISMQASTDLPESPSHSRICAKLEGIITYSGPFYIYVEKDTEIKLTPKKTHCIDWQPGKVTMQLYLHSRHKPKFPNIGPHERPIVFTVEEGKTLDLVVCLPAQSVDNWLRLASHKQGCHAGA